MDENYKQELNEAKKQFYKKLDFSQPTAGSNPDEIS